MRAEAVMTGDMRTLGEEMIRRIRKNYFEIVGIDPALILLGVGGMIRPTTSAMVHNMSTLAIGLDSMKDLLPKATGSADRS